MNRRGEEPSWPLWSRPDIDGLARYVRSDLAGAALVVAEEAATEAGSPPGPDGSDPAVKAAEVFARLAGVGPRYLHEPPGVPAGYQMVRPPHEILGPPGGAAPASTWP